MPFQTHNKKTINYDHISLSEALTKIMMEFMSFECEEITGPLWHATLTSGNLVGARLITSKADEKGELTATDGKS